MSDLNFDGLSNAQLRLFGVRCARRVQHLMTDPRSLAALDVAERHAKGEATDDELAAAAKAAAEAAVVAAEAASVAVWAASIDAARDVAWAAAMAVAWDAWDAAGAASAASDAEVAERKAQQKILDEIKQEQPR